MYIIIITKYMILHAKRTTVSLHFATCILIISVAWGVCVCVCVCCVRPFV